MEMNLQHKRLLALPVLLLSVLLVCVSIMSHNFSVASAQKTKSVCVSTDDTIRAKHKKCLLRPDSGPCRADILAYYYDAKQARCYRFFYGGCQGNGNNFNTQKECLDACLVVAGQDTDHRPYFCSLAFDYGNCFGQYNRWAWDPKDEVCKQRLYSGCGGNQNNYETKTECMATCLTKPNNTHSHAHKTQLTTCIPFTVPGFD